MRHSVIVNINLDTIDLAEKKKVYFFPVGKNLSYFPFVFVVGV